MKNKYIMFFVCLLVCFLPMLGGLAISAESLDKWYAALTKPAFTPPGWLFGPMWTALYLLLSVVLYKLVRADMEHSLRRVLMTYFGWQLFLNFLWTPVFFGFHAVFLALCVIAVMIALCIDFIRQAWQVKRVLAYLMIPYTAWLCYAGYLNCGIYILN